jgi:alkaline phosphatase D
MVLWTRLGRAALVQAGRSHTTVDVTWQLAHDPQFTHIAQSGQLKARPELGHSLHAEVSGLSPARQYYYRFLTGDASSPVGRTRSFPAPNSLAARLRLAYASCQRWGDGFYTAYRDMLAQDLDVVMFLGDYIYEYPPSASRDVRPTTGGWVLTLDEYRDRYALHKSDPHLQAMHAACPWIVTWDDHEVQNDYAELHAGFSGAPVQDFAARRRDAYQATPTLLNSSIVKAIRYKFLAVPNLANLPPCTTLIIANIGIVKPAPPAIAPEGEGSTPSIANCLDKSTERF